MLPHFRHLLFSSTVTFFILFSSLYFFFIIPQKSYFVHSLNINIDKIFTTERINENIAKSDEENGTHYNDEAGFIKVISPVDCKILLRNIGLQNYHELAVKGSE